MSKKKRVFRSFDEVMKAYFPKRYDERNKPEKQWLIILPRPGVTP